ncbi:MAG TPA: hypothetical protein VL096_14835 [Pirellulaceae bacterium]|nr:hypothetical protein [Pirellulaceae bacterium]
MDNPYASPPPLEPRFGDAAPHADANYRPRGMVGHVRVLGILMIVQGALDIAMGLMLIVMAVIMPTMMQNDPAFQRAGADGPSQTFFMWMMIGYAGIGLVVTAIALLHIYAGWQTFNFKQRNLGMISISLGPLAILTCYCFPTSLALLIYGLIVFLNPSVAEAFRLGKEGRSADEIDALFNPYMQSMLQKPS